MKIDMTFGECLQILLSALNISMSRLAKAINVDNSLVNRWIHGKRVPSLNTSYIDNISLYLDKNITNSFQVNILEELFQSKTNASSKANTNQEKIKILLLEAQGYTLQKVRENQKKNSFSPSIPGRVDAPLTVVRPSQNPDMRLFRIRLFTKLIIHNHLSYTLTYILALTKG